VRVPRQVRHQSTPQRRGGRRRRAE
jgi:hypothetical protein